MKRQTLKHLSEEYSRSIARGYVISSATLDGKRGLYKAFKDIPIQKSLSPKKDCTAIFNDATKTSKCDFALAKSFSENYKLIKI